jgi:hypothetical protein
MEQGPASVTETLLFRRTLSHGITEAMEQGPASVTEPLLFRRTLSHGITEAMEQGPASVTEPLLSPERLYTTELLKLWNRDQLQ